MRSLNNDDMEEVFFDYYEGNLSEDEKTKLFSLLDANPSLHHDFMLWKDSYVQEPLPAIGGMERCLIKKEIWSFRTKGYLAVSIAAFAGIVLLFWLITAEHKLDQKSNVVKTQSGKIYKPVVSIFSPSHNNVNLKKNNTWPANKNQLHSVKENLLPMVSVQDTTAAKLNIVNEKNIDVVSDVSIDSTKIGNVPLNLVQKDIPNVTPQTMQLSKKELKQIQKAKEKAKIRRQEQEFLKGDQPYVVPIDPNRF